MLLCERKMEFHLKIRNLLKGFGENYEIILNSCAILHHFFIYSLTISEISLNGQHGKLSETATIKFLLIKLIYNFIYLFLLRSAHIF